MNQSEESQSRSKVLAEVGCFVALAFGSKAIVDQVAWKFSGPITLIFTLVVLTIYLNRQGISWTKLGLCRLEGIKAKVMVIPKAILVFLAFVAAVAPILILGPMMGFEFLAEKPSGVEDRWGDVEGNLPMYLLWLGIVWTSAAFGEEMFFRGYLVSRLKVAFDGWKFENLLAVAFPALVFGLGHFYYQGFRGLIVTGAIGFAFGMMFLLFKRNLWPLILWHGIIDTLTFTALYKGWE